MWPGWSLGKKNVASAASSAMDDDISALLDAMSSDKPTEGGGSDSTDAAQRGADSAATQRDLKTKRQQDKARLPTGTVSSGWHAAEWQRGCTGAQCTAAGTLGWQPPPQAQYSAYCGAAVATAFLHARPGAPTPLAARCLGRRPR